MPGIPQPSYISLHLQYINFRATIPPPRQLKWHGLCMVIKTTQENVNVGGSVPWTVPPDWGLRFPQIGFPGGLVLPTHTGAVLDERALLSLPRIPLGDRTVAVHGPGDWIPDLAETTVTGAPPAVPAEIDRRDATPNEANMAANQWFVSGRENPADLIALQERGYELIQPGDPRNPNTPPAAATPPIVEEENDVGWISDVYDIVDTAAGGWLPGGVPVGSSIPATFGQPTVTQAPAPVPAPVAQVPAPAQGVSMKGYVYKDVGCGEWKWVKKQKRRRKRLATASDIKDLNALMNVFGNGKALQAWIATHS